MEKYSDQFMAWLYEAGYTHCFFVAGGNVMHLLEAASKKFVCVPFIHEVACTIATEYFNESSNDKNRAFVLVTAGPGLTNTITGMAAAWVEGRELLIVGGQAKSSELSRGKYRQIGFQEFDGVSLCKSITKEAFLIDKKVKKSEIFRLVTLSKSLRKGPVFIEFCLDVSTFLEDKILNDVDYSEQGFTSLIEDSSLNETLHLLSNARRPIILIGGEVSRDFDLSNFKKRKIPLATTFNGADRVGIDYKYYAGRPHWYGSRWANLILQQADFILAVGARLGLGQVGYNWEEFAPKAKVVQVFSDANEITKKFPKVDVKIKANADQFLEKLESKLDSVKPENFHEWNNFIVNLRETLSVPELIKLSNEKYLEPLRFVYDLINNYTDDKDVIIPCSSGEASYVGPMRVMLNKGGQKIVTNNAMASMGYGLSGAIGAAFANPNSRIILFEGDGGFSQNLQELSTVKKNKLNLKIFVMNNGGYMSIKQNQKTAFAGHYIGCDSSSGLEMPNWELISKAFGMQYYELDSTNVNSKEFINLITVDRAIFFDVKVDPDQPYFPKILSSRDLDGSIRSNPLHIMEPDLSIELKGKFLKFF
jgi:acetolactate synthase-1/2/3 large subunit